MWAYLCIWAAVRLPFHGADRYGDFSYGLYIYAFVVQQMLALYGITRWGYVPNVVLSLMGTMLLAAASWFAVGDPACGSRASGCHTAVLGGTHRSRPTRRRMTRRGVATQSVPHRPGHRASARFPAVRPSGRPPPTPSLP
jgi:peptidoglycan/LPS O-acetylase OafA/YrhL